MTLTVASFGAQTLYIYMKDLVSLLRIEGGNKAAITTIILSMTTKISYLIVNNEFLIDKLINKMK